MDEVSENDTESDTASQRLTYVRPQLIGVSAEMASSKDFTSPYEFTLPTYAISFGTS